MVRLSSVKIAQPGTNLGIKQTPATSGIIGRAIEKLYKSQGFDVKSSSKGPDLPDLKTEIKTRNADAISPITIGSMDSDEILVTEYKNSSIAKKLQIINLIKYDNSGQTAVITENKILNCLHPNIQKGFEEGYNNIKSYIFRYGVDDNYIRGNEWLYAETEYVNAPLDPSMFIVAKPETPKIRKSWSVEFRISNKTLQTLENFSRSNTAFQNFLTLPKK